MEENINSKEIKTNKNSIDKVSELQQQIKKLEQQKSSLERKQKPLLNKKIEEDKKKPKKETVKKEKVKKGQKSKFNFFKFLKKKLNKEKKQSENKGGQKQVASVSVSAKSTIVDSFIRPGKSNKKGTAAKKAPIKKIKKEDIKVKIDYKAFTQLSASMQQMKAKTAESMKAIAKIKGVSIAPKIAQAKKSPTLKL